MYNIQVKICCMSDGMHPWPEEYKTRYILQESSVWAEEVQQEPTPDIIWRQAAWCCVIAFLTLHWASSYYNYVIEFYEQQNSQDQAYPYLCLYLRGTVHCLLAHCVVNPKNRSLWWKLGGTAVKKPQVWSPLGLYMHVTVSFMTFWPCRTSSGYFCTLYITWSVWTYSARARARMYTMSVDVTCTWPSSLGTRPFTD